MYDFFIFKTFHVVTFVHASFHHRVSSIINWKKKKTYLHHILRRTFFQFHLDSKCFDLLCEVHLPYRKRFSFEYEIRSVMWLVTFILLLILCLTKTRTPRTESLAFFLYSFRNVLFRTVVSVVETVICGLL